MEVQLYARAQKQMQGGIYAYNIMARHFLGV